jgi:hypothetical protein
VKPESLTVCQPHLQSLTIYVVDKKMEPLSRLHVAVLKRFIAELINQDKCHVIVEPLEARSGFWFGGGNLVMRSSDGTIFLPGRYRTVCMFGS